MGSLEANSFTRALQAYTDPEVYSACGPEQGAMSHVAYVGAAVMEGRGVYQLALVEVTPANGGAELHIVEETAPGKLQVTAHRPARSTSRWSGKGYIAHDRGYSFQNAAGLPVAYEQGREGLTPACSVGGVALTEVRSAEVLGRPELLIDIADKIQEGEDAATAKERLELPDRIAAAYEEATAEDRTREFYAQHSKRLVRTA